MKGISKSQFLRFCMIGVAGFLIDTSALYAAMSVGGIGLYTGRAFSFTIAATSTWALNRRFTFHAQRSSNLVYEWARFFAANSLGGLVNYSVYAALVAASDIVAQWPVLGVAAGSIAGLAINFTLTRQVVFIGDRL